MVVLLWLTGVYAVVMTFLFLVLRQETDRLNKLATLRGRVLRDVLTKHGVLLVHLKSRGIDVESHHLEPVPMDDLNRATSPDDIDWGRRSS